MSLRILDTDILTLYRHGHPPVRQRIDASPASELRVTVISVEEILSGWYTYVRRAKRPEMLARGYENLANSVEFLATWPILRYSLTAIARYDELAALKLQVKKMDLRIAAIALANSAIVVTRNTRDFQRVPNLNVENWAI